MRYFLYEQIEKALTDGDNRLCSTFDLWNEQVDFVEQEEAFECPAIFVEFREIEYLYHNNNAKRANISFRLHVVTDYAGNARDGSTTRNNTYLRFRLLEQIAEALIRLNDNNGRYTLMQLTRLSSSTNHNHEELVEDIETYKCTVIDRGFD